MLLASFNENNRAWKERLELCYRNTTLARACRLSVTVPTGIALEDTAAAVMEMGRYLKTVNEVTDFQIYAGTAGPHNFNGLVRHYYLRQEAFMADIQVNLVEKGHRRQQSHAIAKRVRPALKAIADRHGARIKVAEVPPGPPVLATLVAEIYGPDYQRQRELAERLHVLRREARGRAIDRADVGRAHQFDERSVEGVHRRPVAAPVQRLEHPAQRLGGHRSLLRVEAVVGVAGWRAERTLDETA